jgi:isopenicillin N synthase-like dioxygenase
MLIIVILLFTALFFGEVSSEATVLMPPVIDIGALLRDPSSAEAGVAVGQMVDACSRWGFFNVINHGIDTSAAMAECRRFFAQPLEWKNKVERSETNARGYTNHELTKQIVDLKEVFDFGHKLERDLADDDLANHVPDGFNQFPRDNPAFKKCMEQYYNDCSTLAISLLDAIAKVMGVPSVDVEALVSAHTSFMRLNHYPEGQQLASSSPLHTDSVLGISRHTDAGLLTILTQDVIPGLEVYSGSKQDAEDGEWVPVDPVPGALTINTGDMLQVWSNDRFKAAEHRVRASLSGRQRHSIALFLNPSYSAVISPLVTSEASAETPPPRYRPISWGEYRALRFQSDYTDAGRDVQIEDYRLLP